MSSRKDRRRCRSTSICDDNAYNQNIHSSSRRHKKEHRSRSEIRRNDEINQTRDEIRRHEREIKNLKQKMEKLELSRSPNRSRRSQNLRRERSVQSCERRRRSPKHSSSRESSQSRNSELFEASKSSNRSCGSLYSRKETSASKRTSTHQTYKRRTRSQSGSSSRSSSQSQDSSYSRGRGEQFKTSKSSNRSCGSQYSRKETSVSKRTSIDRTYDRRTRSQSRSSSRESNQRQNRSHSRERKRSRSGSHSRKRDLGYQHQPTRNSRRSRTPDRQPPSLPAHWNRPRIQSDKDETRYLESPGIVDKEQNCYESKIRVYPEERTGDPNSKRNPYKKPDQNEPLECVNLQKFPFDEFELIGDSLSHYLARALWKRTANVRKPYLKEQISLTALYRSIKPVTFTRSKAIVSMAQFELNVTDTCYMIVQKRVKKVIDLLIEKGFEKIIILFPVIKPVSGNQNPVSMSSYIMYLRAFEQVCDYRRVTLWWKPAAVFLQLKKDERCPGKMTFDEDEDGNMIPLKYKFYPRKIGGTFRPDRDRKHEVLVEIDKLYCSAYFSGKRPEMYFVEE